MYNNQRILAIITARGGSKGIPRKNIKYLVDKPLISWTIEAAKKSNYIDKVLVSTEDDEIKNISLKYKAEVPFLRPMELAKDDSSSVDTVYYTIEKLNKSYDQNYDFVLLLQPTSPLRNSFHIDESIEKLLDNLNKYDSLVSVTKLKNPIYWNRKIDEFNTLKNILKYDKNKKYRRQSFEQIYRLNGAVYLIKIDSFLKNKSFETDKTLPYIMDRVSSIDIDDIEDFDLAEYYIKKDKLN